MSIRFNNFSLSEGLKFFAEQTEKIADKVVSITCTILNEATTGLGQLLPDLSPISVSEVFTQAKKAEAPFLRHILKPIF